MTARNISEDWHRVLELDADYVVVRELERAAATVAYVARERDIGRLVVLRMLCADAVADGDAAAALAREARALAGAAPAASPSLYATRRLRDGSLVLVLPCAEETGFALTPPQPAVAVETGLPVTPPESAVAPEPAGAEPLLAAVPAAGLPPKPRRRARRLAAAAAGIGLVALGVVASVTRRAERQTVTAATFGELYSPAQPEAEPARSATGVPAIVHLVGGEHQQGVAGDTLREWLAVRVFDDDGRPLRGATVRFAVASGDGVVVPALVATDELGLAGARLLPRRSGRHTVTAEVDGLPGKTLLFHADVRAGAAARLHGAGETTVRIPPGPRAAATVAVRVEDALGNPVERARVQFAVRSGAGRVTPASALTSVDGVASAEWLFGATAAQEVVATLPAVAGASVSFHGAAADPGAVRASLAAGGTHTCLIAPDGAARCWGANDYGQLGDGATGRRADAVRVAATEPWMDFSAGVSHSCGVAWSGVAWCWGANSSGQLGNATRSDQARPVRVAGNLKLVTIVAGMSHTCGVDGAGALYCWGQNTHGQLGDGTRTDRLAPVPVRGTGRVLAVTLGWAHTCALTADGRAWCWGRNTSGELGEGGTADRPRPAPVAGTGRFTALAAGSGHTCAVRRDGALLCWGHNAYGQLGTGSSTAASQPVAAAAEEPFASVTAGTVHSCALTRSGIPFCWGRNTYGQLGDGTVQDRATPAPVAGSLRLTALHANGAHTCGTTASGAAYCWGYNAEGQLGIGNRANQTRPVEVVR